jgi:uncharacterized protein YecT (DUF1311 family)
MNTILAVLGIFLSALSIPSYARQKEQPEGKCCCTTYDTGQCLVAVKGIVDAEVNDTYEKALKRWNQPTDSDKLKEAQRLWLNYRDANCEAEEATYNRGTMGPNAWALCRIRLTRQRIEEMKLIYLPEH